jgi:uncharacterized protein YodC (DUF2158 family)
VANGEDRGNEREALMSDEQIKAGDVVKLKSGGNKMTVAAELVSATNKPTGTWQCFWFVAGELKTANIAGAALTKNTAVGE